MLPKPVLLSLSLFLSLVVSIAMTQQPLFLRSNRASLSTHHPKKMFFFRVRSSQKLTELKTSMRQQKSVPISQKGEKLLGSFEKPKILCFVLLYEKKVLVLTLHFWISNGLHRSTFNYKGPFTTRVEEAPTLLFFCTCTVAVSRTETRSDGRN